MKSLKFYYFIILIPIPFIIWLAIYDYTILFIISLLFYWLPYRIIVDGVKLVKMKVIQPNDIWKFVIPGRRIKYTRELYLRN